MRLPLPTRLAARLGALLALAGCTSDQSLQQAPAPDAGFAGAMGVERVQAFAHLAGAAHLGVDAIRMPFRDADSGELRDRHLLLSAVGTGVLATLVDDAWQKVDEVFWAAPGLTVPWSDLKVARVRDADGRERVLVYYASRGSDQLQITDVTDFPAVTTTAVTVDLGLPVAVRGVHTLQVHERRGVLVLNGVDVGADNLPAPLTIGCAPAAFYDIATDPLAPRLLSLFVGDEPGTQTLFDSQFLELDGRDVWAPTLARPHQQLSFFAFYDFANPADMQNATRLAYYATPTTGQAHNVVALPPRADGTQLLCGGYEAWAFTAGPEQMISKAAVLEVPPFGSGRAPRLVSWLASTENWKDAVHNPCSRLAEVRTHTHDTVPLAHFTGGYYLYEYGESTAKVMAHVPISRVAPSGRFGAHHKSMTVPVWMACYNGSWDAVATWIGDYVSSTDRETSYLIEPTYGFARQFGTYLPAADGTVPRAVLSGPIPEVGKDLHVRVLGLVPGGRVELTIATRAVTVPYTQPGAGALWFDPASVVHTLQANAVADHVDFVLPNLPDHGRQLVLTAIQYDVPGSTAPLKTPAAVFRPRPRQP